MGNSLDEKSYFYLSNGDVLKSISDLKLFLSKNNSSIFANHVNAEKNDFYNWVKYALGDDAVAGKIKNSKSSLEMLDSLNSVEKPNQIQSVANFKNLNDDIETASISKKSVRAPSKKVTVKESDRSRTDSKKAKAIKLKSKKVKKSKTSYSSDFDYSLDFDEQHDALTKIRKRIEAMDLELRNTSSYSRYNSKNFAHSEDVPSQEHTNDKLSKKTFNKFSSNESSRNYVSRSLKDLDDRYPELSHKEVDESELKSLKSSKPKKKLHHHIQRVAKNTSGHVRNHARKIQSYVSDNIEEAKRKSKLKRLTSSAKSNSKNQTKEEDSKLVKHEMENFYGKPINEDSGKVPKKKVGLFSGLITKFKKASKVAKHELPNLHDFEHAKKAQEFVTSDDVVANNYHFHGVQDFIKGLIIGILLGMIFLAIF